MDPRTNVRPGPEWQAIGEEILCPLCEYDLQGLSQPRCPECGYTFDWQDLIDPTRRLHRYIFEHHPERNFRSFWKTTAGILRPRQFWRSLQPVQPSFPRRLVFYWVLTVLVGFGLFAATVFGCITWVGGWPNFGQNRAYQVQQIAMQKTVQGWDQLEAELIRQYGSIENAMEDWYPTHLSWHLVQSLILKYGPLLILWGLLQLPWPWMMFVSLLVFRWSMRRAKIRPIHVLRCCIYTSGMFVWLGVVTPFLAIGGTILYQSAAVNTDTLVTMGGWLVVGLLLMMLYQLITAYRLYLRFDHSIATVACAQVIAILALAAGVQTGAVLLHLW